MTKIHDRRRVEDKKELEDRRTLADRRFIPSEHQVETIHNGSDRLIALLLRQRIRKNSQTERRIAGYFDGNIQSMHDKRFIGDRRNVRVKLPSVNNEKSNRQYEV
jgi:hypothetical protein